MQLSLDVRWQHGQQEPVEFEPELFPLLHEVEASGSLLTASRNRRISYRYAWGLMRAWAARLGQPLVELQRGRGARLTELGEKLLWEHRRINARLTPQLESLAAELNSCMAAIMEHGREVNLRIYASHGLALGLLRDLYNTYNGQRLELQYHGSLESLRLFRAGKCDIAGFHFPVGDLAARLVPRYRPFLDEGRHVLVNIVNRSQGIMTAAGNPHRIKSIADLIQPGVRFINREPAAGTRVIFDALLDKAGIESTSVRGYDNEEFTHTAVAAIVAGGAADAGFGIQAAAVKMGLHFIPLVRERYLFVLRREDLHTAPLTSLCKVLRSSAFRKAVHALSGYDATGAGVTSTFAELFAGE